MSNYLPVRGENWILPVNSGRILLFQIEIFHSVVYFNDGMGKKFNDFNLDVKSIKMIKS